MTKKLFIKTYGCQMNVYDSERMTEVMAREGYGLAETADDADLVIMNTCHIREKAAEKVYSDIGRFKASRIARAERGGGDTVIAVGGCVGQAEGAEIMHRAPSVDMVFGPQTYHRLPDMVARATDERSRTGHARVLDTEFPVEDKFSALPAPNAGGATSFLTIQEGCDKFCTFCVVPYTRGAEFSRPLSAIRNEALKLVTDGVAEITLLGQNVNAYHGDNGAGGTASLAQLIRSLAGIDGLERIRYTTSHPRDMDDDLIDVHGSVPQCMPYLHLPVQSGSDTILAAMNRKHKADDYRRIIERLRVARPDIALSGDFIVGFPGETAADFRATMDLVRDVRYAQAYSFKYSPRPGTPAAEMENQVPEMEKAERLAELQTELARQQQAFNETAVGVTMPVLFERRGRKAAQLVGRSPYMQAVHIDVAGEAEVSGLINRLADVKIISAGPRGLIGHLTGMAAE